MIKIFFMTLMFFVHFVSGQQRFMFVIYDESVDFSKNVDSIQVEGYIYKLYGEDTTVNADENKLYFKLIDIEGNSYNVDGYIVGKNNELTYTNPLVRICLVFRKKDFTHLPMGENEFFISLLKNKHIIDEKKTISKITIHQ